MSCLQIQGVNIVIIPIHSQMRQFDRDKTMGTSLNDSCLPETYIENMHHHYFDHFWKKHTHTFIRQLQANRPFEINGMTTYSQIRNRSGEVNESCSEELELEKLMQERSYVGGSRVEKEVDMGRKKMADLGVSVVKKETDSKVYSKVLKNDKADQPDKSDKTDNQEDTPGCNDDKAVVSNQSAVVQPQKMKQKDEPQQVSQVKEAQIIKEVEPPIQASEDKEAVKVVHQTSVKDIEQDIAEEPSVIEDIPVEANSNSKEGSKREQRNSGKEGSKKGSSEEEEVIEEDEPTYYNLIHKQEQEIQSQDIKQTTPKVDKVEPQQPQKKTQQAQKQSQQVQKTQQTQQKQKDKSQSKSCEQILKEQVKKQQENVQIESQNNKQISSQVQQTNENSLLPKQSKEQQSYQQLPEGNSNIDQSPPASPVTVTSLQKQQKLQQQQPQEKQQNQEIQQPQKQQQQEKQQLSLQQRVNQHLTSLLTFIDNQHLCSNCESTRKALTQLSTENQQLKDQLSQTNIQNSTLKANSQSLQNDLEQVSIQNEQLKNKVKQLIEVNDRLKKEHFEMGVELQKKQKRVKELQDRGEDFYSGRKSNGRGGIKREMSAGVINSSVVVKGNGDLEKGQKNNLTAPLPFEDDEEYESIKNSSDQDEDQAESKDISKNKQINKQDKKNSESSDSD